MPRTVSYRTVLLLPLLALGACGGGGGGPSPTPAPPVAPTPSPAPTPAPTPSPTAPGSFETFEYRQSTGLVAANVLPAYEAGATGQGVVAGVIDSGVDTGSAEFAGRISSASADLAGSRPMADEDGHGTAVASVLLGARNGQRTHGVAFEATLLALKADKPGSCATPGADGESGCTFPDLAIARGLDLAVAQKARVVNISLGGGGADSTLRAAFDRATAAGVVIVISAGNDAAADPDVLARIASDPVARDHIIVVGATDSAGRIADFSNRAGADAAHYIAALGVDVRAIDNTGTLYSWEGTSLAAPHVAGAIALLAQAFPNLTGAQLVELLLQSATDAGAPGTDPVYGRGVLNIGKAFEPQGTMRLAGSLAPVSLTAVSTLSPAMGDAADTRSMALEAVVLDGYARAYAADVGGVVRTAPPSRGFGAALAGHQRSLAATSNGGAVIAVSILPGRGGAGVEPLRLSGREADRARATAGWVAGRLGRSLDVAVGVAQGGGALAARLAGRNEPAFLVAASAADQAGFLRSAGGAFAMRRSLGATTLWMTAEQGDALVWRERAVAPGRGQYQAYPFATVTFGADRAFGRLGVTAALAHMVENRTVLGASFGPAFGSGQGRSWFTDLTLRYALGDGWALAAATRQGWTRVGAGGAAPGATLIRTDAYAFDISGSDLFAPDDRFALRVSQPLRVRSGGFALNLPVGYSYASGVTAFAPARLNLAPAGREVTTEASYGFPLLGGRVDANLFWRQDPGNIAAMPDDRGGALRFAIGF
ncbi:S8 family peptidase [Sphingomonas flavalba]|uniref:S8 family peptidase n=1 Tax=Sphingomonas flavalba TaxID=2559804 RepID=UPI0039E1FDD5